jgi:DNA-binding FrmR family transcriptional regulator
MDTPGYHDHKVDYLKRLRRIEGQVRGLQRMVDEDVYCIDILTQVSAVKSALQSVSVGLVEDHLGHCVQDGRRGQRGHHPPAQELTRATGGER